MSIVRTAYAFTPTSITGCALWLDGADPAGTGVVPASGTLATWVDKSGSGNNAIAYTGATAPSYSSATSNVTFGTNYYYITGISSAPANETLFMVLRRTSTIWNTPYGTSITGGATWYMDNANPTFIAWNPFGQNNSSGANLLFYNNVTNVVCGTNSSGTNVMYLNGTGDTAGSTSFTSGGIMTIGTSSSGTNGAPTQNGFIGTISEVIFYNSVLGTTQRQQVEGYLAQKWGATSSFVAGHPGRTSRIYRSDYLVPNKVKPTPYYTQFSPRQISGLVVWLDGADPAGNGVIPANGSTISTWTDKSGNGNNGTAVNTPTYTLSSKGVATSSGAYFTLPNGAFPFNDSSYTYFFVFTTTTTGSVNSLFGGGVPGTTRSTVAVRLGTNGANNVIQTYWWQNGVGDLLVTNTYSANVISIAETWYATGSTRTITLNFAGSSTDSPAVPGARLQANTNNYLGLAYPGDGALTGFHYEFLVYNTSLSTTNRQQVESYLAQKWGLTASIPSGHSHLTQQAGAVTTVALSKFKVTGLPRVIVATGGTITTVGSYRFHTFTYPGGTFIVSANPSTVQALVVGGGGGGGGYYNGGGGGAGGAVYNSAFSIGVGSYTVTIGNGGAGASGGNTAGTSGGATTFSTLTGNGGGAGGSDQYVNGVTGGCGGGMGPLGASAPGSGNQGYAGGYGTNGPNMGTLGGAYGSGYGGGGGGGMGSVGSNALTSAGPGRGGTGYTYVVGGQNYLVAGGGGAGTADTDNTNFGLGGSSIGGVGGLNTARVAGNGAANTGSGGGGYGRVGTGSAGGTGGTGIVVIAYRVS
jgi:hypothetical protein